MCCNCILSTVVALDSEKTIVIACAGGLDRGSITLSHGQNLFIVFVLLVVYGFYWAWALLQTLFSSRQPQAEVRSSRQNPRTSRQESIQQQAAITAAMQRQHQPSPAVLAPVPSNSAGASAVSVRRVPLDGSTSRPRFAMAAQEEPLDVCVLCMDASKDWVCIPCGHLALCGRCSARVKLVSGRCPICKQAIEKVMQVFRV